MSQQPQPYISFDESHRNLIKIRWTTALAAVANIAYGSVYNWLDPNYYDPMWQRLIVSAVFLAVSSFTVRRKGDDPRLIGGFNFAVFLLSGHIFFLIIQNHVLPIYVMGSLILFFSAGAVFGSLRTVAIYFVVCISASVWIYFAFPGPNSIILLLASVVAAGMSYTVFASMMYLIKELRDSRGAIAVKTQALDNMLNSLGQGFFSFFPNGVCTPIFSRACVALLESEPGNRPVVDVLRSEIDPIEILAAFKNPAAMAHFIKRLPTVFKHSGGRYVTLEYYPSLDNNHAPSEVVVVATDRTDLIRAERSAEAEKRNSMMISTIVKQKRFFRVFLDDLNRGIERFQPTGSKFDILEFKRFLHSIKGGAGMFWMDELSTLIHRCEQEWVNSDSVSNVQLATHHTKLIQDYFQKFVIANSDVLGNEFRTGRLAEFPLTELQRIFQKPEFEATHQMIQMDIAQLTLQPIAKYFEPFSDLVQRLARSQRKLVKPIVFTGGDIAIFPEPYSKLFSSFVHAFRNAVDHGVELPSERLAQGKPEKGMISVEFRHSTEEGLSIAIHDDGRGVDPQRVREKMRLLGLNTQGAAASDSEVLQFVFEPGFSTASQLTEVSGRGVGLDAIKFSAVQLGGSVRFESILGQGSTLVVHVPNFDAGEYLQRPFSEIGPKSPK